MIKLFQPYVSQKARDNVLRVLSGNQLAQGPEVELFEQEFADKFGYQKWQIVSLNSGTSALELAYQLTGIGEADEVITPVLTCTATNVPLVRLKAHAIFADIEGKNHLNIDSDDVLDKITESTRAIVFVHFGGSSEGLSEIEEVCEQHDIDLICDAAQALGNELSTKARFNCISLQAIKSLTAGDGGILICRDREDADKARKLRWFGYDREKKQKEGDCDLELAGYKMHMNDINAAIARGNLADWDEIFEHRRAINEIYYEAWKNSRGNALKLIPGIWNPQVIMHEYIELHPSPEIWAEELGFEIGQYHFPNYKYSIFRSFSGHTPNMHRMEKNYFILPCHMGMTLDDARLIAKTLWPKN